MAKNTTNYVCSECGFESSGWLGRCPSCSSWNSFTEQRTVQTPKANAAKGGIQRGWLQDLLNQDDGPEANLSELQTLDNIQSQSETYVSSGIPEFDRVLGGGFVPGSLVLLGGDPGIGKSTLLLQACAHTRYQGSVLYVCGEESPQQVKLRADRLEIKAPQLRLSTEIIFERIAEIIMKLRPKLCIVDSIQTMYSEQGSSAPGTVSQVRDVTAGLLRLAKSLGTTVVLVGHVTKDGSLAGPRVLEHMVDTVLYFEGDNQNPLRLIRTIKNRFGTTNELGVFEMTAKGLLSVKNASLALLESRPHDVPGSAITCTLEGTRPLMLEIQALLAPAGYGTPQRMSQGIDRTRVSMLIALLEKQLGMNLSNMDSFINVVGGLRITEPAADLALVAAITSSFRDKALKDMLLLLGEVGLTGEVRPISAISERLLEATRLGFKAVIMPGSHRQTAERFLRSRRDLTLPDLYYVDHVSEALDIAFG